MGPNKSVLLICGDGGRGFFFLFPVLWMSCLAQPYATHHSTTELAYSTFIAVNHDLKYLYHTSYPIKCSISRKESTLQQRDTSSMSKRISRNVNADISTVHTVMNIITNVE